MIFLDASDNIHISTGTYNIGGPSADDCGNLPETSREIQSNTKIESSIDYVNDYDYFSFKPSKEGNCNLRDFAAKTNTTYYDEPYLGHFANIYNSDLRYFQMTYIDDYNTTFYFEKDHTYYFVVSSASYDYFYC
ncbi:MAG TPA: hypothetical protein VIO64_14740 [Pseudobacteroides sp.]|uniref:hypothetical protein n=1 Tax=Pseudobacteroides sp. TaxID=1968840 RepID=UPI002F946D0B